MLRSLFLIFIYLSFLGLGMAAPFVLTLGYIWVDTFRPQSVAYFVLNQFPVALVMGGGALMTYCLMDRRSPPRFTLITFLTLFMGCWITLTLMWAEVPSFAWAKWDWAFKTIMFSAFIPVVIRSRIQIEAFAQTYVFSLAANFVPFGMKALIGGGGYEQNLGLEGGNSNLAEGGLLSTVCLMAIPLALYLARNTQLLPRAIYIRLGYFGLCMLALTTALGTFERSALVGMIVLGCFLFINSRHKVFFLVIAALVGGAIVYHSSAAWTTRMSTIATVGSEKDGTLTRLLVWKWTLGYVMSHPFGGGFQACAIDTIEFPDGTVQFGRAFHSIWFETLGEHGWVGLGTFISVALLTLRSLRRVMRATRNVAELQWCRDLAGSLQAGLVTFLACGTFVGIAFQPEFWYFVAMGTCVSEYVHRYQTAGAESSGWRARRFASPAMAGAAGAIPATGGRAYQTLVPNGRRNPALQ